jgi:hypothetical protein
VYAQILAGTLRGDDPEELGRRIRAELLPTLRTARGFSGALCLRACGSPDFRLFVFWETEDEAAAPLAGFGAAAVWEVEARS